MIDSFYNLGLNAIATSWWRDGVWLVIWNLLKIVLLLAPLMGAVAYLTLWERKLLGWMQVRHGPNRVGPMGLLQPIADANLPTKELIQPSAAAKGLFVLGPIMAIMPALAAWVAIPFWTRNHSGQCKCWSSCNFGYHFYRSLWRNYCRMGF